MTLESPRGKSRHTARINNAAGVRSKYRLNNACVTELSGAVEEGMDAGVRNALLATEDGGTDAGVVGVKEGLETG